LRCAKNADACWRRDDIACNYCIDQKNKRVSINDLILIRLLHLMLVRSHVNFVEQRINWWACDVEFMSKSCRRRFWTRKLRVSSSLSRFENVIWERYMIDLKSFSDQIRLFAFFANVMRNIQQSLRIVVSAFFSSFVEISLIVLKLIEICSWRTISFFFRRTSMMKTSILTYKDFECVAMCFELFS
jgi:hypothetical protein